MNCKTANNCFDGGSGAGNVAQSGGRGGKRVSVGNRASHTSMSMYLVHNLMDCIPTRHNHAANLHLSTQELNQLPWMGKPMSTRHILLLCTTDHCMAYKLRVLLMPGQLIFLPCTLPQNVSPVYIPDDCQTEGMYSDGYV